MQWEYLQLDRRQGSQFGHKLCGFKAIAQPRPAWVSIWDVFSLREDVKLPHVRAQANPQLPGTGKPPLWADNSIADYYSPFEVPVKTVSRGLARWTARLIWCDSSTALFQARSSGERWCWLQITGASTEPSHSALWRPCPCQPTCQVSFWGRSFSVYTKNSASDQF